MGTIGGGVLWLSLQLWPPLVAVLLSTITTIWLTGAFHEDAVADVCDGFGGGWHREQILEIMKDSRVGAYGVVGVVLVIATKVASLSVLAAGGGTGAVTAPLLPAGVGGWGALIAGHTIARWSSLPLIWKLPYVRPVENAARPGAGRPFADGVTTGRLVAATLVTVLVSALLFGWLGVAAMLAGVGVTMAAGQYFRRRIGGITGDTLGATNQVVEVSVYLVLAASI